ncbi:integral membrane protein [Teratosphaeria destructans]|uniref:Integral membrane protein n=1 Tax=Teratosphaeria destructans TaxID=418781 RepID=A0A9W7VZI5_9PEZI|nr:integral membrane protein [Teratosphaeria destructans]
MATPDEEKDNATKARIINHMNTDHHDTLIRTLQHHHHLTAYTAYPARLTTLDLTGLTLVLPGAPKTYRVPFRRPLTTYAEARQKITELDDDAAPPIIPHPPPICSIPRHPPPMRAWRAVWLPWPRMRRGMSR